MKKTDGGTARVTTILVSPGEHSTLKGLGELAVPSLETENRGADVLIFSPGGAIGIQIKEVPHDFLSSVSDGRLARETALMRKTCAYGLVLCRGGFRFYRDGHVIVGGPKEPYRRFTHSSIEKILWGIRIIKGIDIDYVDDEQEQVSYVRRLASWAMESSHLGLFRRPGLRGAWGTPMLDEEQSWLLQGFSSCGPKTAEKILQAFGRMPFRMLCSQEDLEDVVGRSMAKNIFKVVETPSAKVALKTRKPNTMV